jgi:hypothetical protein
MSHLDEGTLTALFDGELAAEARQQAERHLADCGECRSLYEEIRGFAGEAAALVESLQPAPVPAPGQSAGAPRARTGWERYRPLAWAATLVLAAGLGWSASTLRFTPAEGGPSADESGRLGPAAPALLALPDEPTAEVPAREAPSPAGTREDDAARRQAAPPPAQATTGAAKAIAAPPAAAAPGAPRNQAARDESALPADQAAGMAVAEQPPQARPLEARARRDAPSVPTGYREASLEEVVRLLGGTVKLIDGMQPARVELGPAERLAGGPATEVVRVTYLDPPGRELWLDQQRNTGPNEGRTPPATPGLLAGDTVVTAAAGGLNRVRWITPDGFRLTLTGYLPGDSLRTLVRRVH